MTITEVIQSYPALADVRDIFLQKTLLDRGLNGGWKYDPVHKNAVDLCVADLYTRMVNEPDFSEGELSIKYPREAMLATAQRIYNATGETETGTERQATMKDASSKW